MKFYQLAYNEKGAEICLSEGYPPTQVSFLEALNSDEEVSIDLEAPYFSKLESLTRDSQYVNLIIFHLVCAIQQASLLKRLKLTLGIFQGLKPEDIQLLAEQLAKGLKQALNLARVEITTAVRPGSLGPALAVLAEDSRIYFHQRIIDDALSHSKEHRLEDFDALKKMLQEHRILFERENFDWEYNPDDPEIELKMDKVAEGLIDNQSLKRICIRKSFQETKKDAVPLQLQKPLLKLIQRNPRVQLEISDYRRINNTEELEKFFYPGRPIIFSFDLPIRLTARLPQFLVLIACNQITFKDGELRIQFSEEDCPNNQTNVFKALAANTSLTRLEVTRPKPLSEEKKLFKLLHTKRLKKLVVYADMLQKFAPHNIDLVVFLKENPQLEYLRVNSVLNDDKTTRELFFTIQSHPCLGEVYLSLIDNNNNCYSDIEQTLRKNPRLFDCMFSIKHTNSTKPMPKERREQLKQYFKKEVRADEEKDSVSLSQYKYETTSELTISLAHRRARRENIQSIWATRAVLSTLFLSTNSPLASIKNTVKLQGEIMQLMVAPQKKSIHDDARASKFIGALFAKQKQMSQKVSAQPQQNALQLK